MWNLIWCEVSMQHNSFSIFFWLVNYSSWHLSKISSILHWLKYHLLLCTEYPYILSSVFVLCSFPDFFVYSYHFNAAFYYQVDQDFPHYSFSLKISKCSVSSRLSRNYFVKLYKKSNWSFWQKLLSIYELIWGRNKHWKYWLAHLGTL